jgi:hypothetical protein
MPLLFVSGHPFFRATPIVFLLGALRRWECSGGLGWRYNATGLISGACPSSVCCWLALRQARIGIKKKGDGRIHNPQQASTQK